MDNKNTRPRSQKVAAVMMAGLFAATAAVSAPSEALALTQAGSKGTVTVQALDPSAKVTYYKLVNVNWNDAYDAPKDPMYTWANDSIKNWVRTANGGEFNAYIDADGNVTEAFASTVAGTHFGNLDQNYTNNTEYKAYDRFYSQLRAAIQAGTVSGLETIATDNVQQSLGMGLWLANVTDGASVYRPMTVNMVPVYDAAAGEWVMPTYEAAAKGSRIMDENGDGSLKPGVAGSNGTGGAGWVMGAGKPAQVAGGQEFTFDTTVRIPELPQDARDGSIVVGLGSALNSGAVMGTVNPGDVKVTVNKGLAGEKTYTLDQVGTVHESGKGGCDFYVALSNDFVKANWGNDVTFEVTEALRDNLLDIMGGDNGERPDVKVWFATDPYVDIDTKGNHLLVTDEGRVHTYGLDLNLTRDVTKDAVGNTQVTKFQILRADGSVVDTFKKVGDNYVNIENSVRDAVAGTTDVLTVTWDNNAGEGTLRAIGLEPGTYTLRNVEVEGGFMRLNDSTFTVADKANDGIVDGAHEWNEGALTVKKALKPGTVLPGTGGALIAAILGGTGLGAAGLALVSRFSKKRS